MKKYTNLQKILNSGIHTTNISSFSQLGNLHSILIGIMLGDGSLYRSSPSSNVRFEMSLGQNYKEFASELGNLFKEYMNNPVKALKIKG
jgi:DNA-binding transcriptional regulator WhiA